jgi:hopanoid biosynthesis associated protein HpnK
LRRLIINADDFGLTSGVNRGILQAYSDGIVNSSTLMACGPQFDEAVSLSAAAPGLSVGCHVLLVDGSPASPANQVASLLQRSTPRFRDSLAQFALLAATGRLDGSQIEAEITAQIRKLQSAGIQVSHLDSHKHTHMFPIVFKAMTRAAKKCGVRALRNPFEPLIFAKTSHWIRRFQLGLLRSYRASFRKALSESGLVTPDGCIGIVATGGLTSEIFRELIDRLPEGTWEFVSHPGYCDDALNRTATRLKGSRERELAILTSAETREALRRAGIVTLSYREFAESRPANT